MNTLDTTDLLPRGDPSEAKPLVEPFPMPGRIIELAYRQIALATTGTPEQIRALGDPRQLPHPWNPATCTAPTLRRALWSWLDNVAAWINTQYGWQPDSTIPPCWPHHPHLIHELATLADQRRNADLALDSDSLEEWHRYALPQFIERMNSRLRSTCDDGHTHSPARSRHALYNARANLKQRESAFADDLAKERTPGHRARVALLDLETGEVIDSDTRVT